MVTRPLSGCLSLGCCLLGILTVLNAAAVARVAPLEKTSPAAPRTLAEAQRNIELADLRLRQFDRFDYPLAQQRLAGKIRLTEAEIASLKRQIKEYERFTLNAYSSPLFFTLETTRLRLLEAELRLKQLRGEKRLRIQFKGATRRIYELEAEQARAWLKQFGDIDDRRAKR